MKPKRTGPRRGADPRQERASREADGSRERVRAKPIEDPKGRRVTVERLTGASPDVPRKPRYTRADFAPPGADDKPFRRPREDGDRPPRRAFGDRPPRSDGDRPYTPRGPAREGDRGPRREFDDRPPRRASGDRPPRRDGDERPPRRDASDRPPRADRAGGFGGKPFGAKPFGGRPSGGRPSGGGRGGPDRGGPDRGGSGGDKPRGPRKPRF
jgi:23S rRNA pseudouridine2605 synthase